MLEAYKLVKEQLSTLGIPTFAELYPLALADKKVYPYIVFNFPNTLSANFADVNLLEIDIWDNKTSIIEIETLAKQVDDIFKNLMVTNESMFCNCFRNTPYRLKLDDETNGIQRRQMRYFCKCWIK